MRSRFGSVLCVVFTGATLVPAAAAAGGFEGAWVGGFKARADWILLRVTLGGEQTVPSGRVDLPLSGIRAALLHNIRFRADRVSFEMPASDGNVIFDGTLEANTIRGSVRQGVRTGAFELMRQALISQERMASLLGNFELDPGRTILLYESPQGPAYVDYGSGRAGLLFPVDQDVFVSGPNLLAAFPVDLRVTIERDVWGSVTGLTWQARGQPPMRGRRSLRYRTENVTFTNGDVRLGASLLIPLRPGPFPAIVMIHGSGAVPRGALMPVADVLARNGIAVLVPDKRGAGTSSGDAVRATFDDLAGDALAGVAFLAGRADIDPRQIGLQGASLGGWIAPLAASRSRAVAFIVVESAPATTPAEHERNRVQNQMRADGVPPDSVAQALAFMDLKAKVGRSGKGWNDLVRVMQKGRSEGWLGYTNPPSSLESLVWHWKHVMSYDPVPALERLTCPVLALYGELDTIVAAQTNGDRMEKALAKAGNRDVTVTVVRRANHNFLAASRGGPGELTRLRGFAPGYLEIGLDWLRAHVDEPGLPVPPVVAMAEGIDLNARSSGPWDESRQR